MTVRCNYYWRLAMTAVSFFSFSLFGTVLSISVFPLLWLCPMPQQRKTELSQWMVHKAFWFFVQMMRALGVLTFSVEGQANLNQDAGHVVVANHPSLIDVVLLIALMPKACCIVKNTLWRNPCIAGIISASGYIKNSADPDQVLAACLASLQQGQNLIIFPEGTRTVPGEALKMQRGAANIALRCGADVIAVTIKVCPTTLTKSEPWYRIPSCKPHFSLAVASPICLSSICPDELGNTRNSRAFTRYLTNHFQQEL